jgi:FkbM family methyltransferase
VGHLGSYFVKTVNGCLRSTLGVEVKRSQMQGQRRGGWLRSLGVRSVIDVGANTGQFATYVAALLPDATIYSIEPLPDCVAQLELLKRKGYKLRVFPYACGASSSVGQFHRSEFSASSSLLPMARRHKELFPFTANGTIIQTQVRRLDDLVTSEDIPAPLLVKLDVQGFEDRVIHGGKATLARAVVVLTEINFEPLYEQQADFESTYRLLVECGFEFRGMWEQYLNTKTGCPVFGDALFTRRGLDGRESIKSAISSIARAIP